MAWLVTPSLSSGSPHTLVWSTVSAEISCVDLVHDGSSHDCSHCVRADLLIRYELWTVSTLVVKLCPLPKINEMSQVRHTVQTAQCSHCSFFLIW